jgi:DNA-binding transcriptional ArsR family regulator
MNERRLACLAVVLKTPGLSVGEIAVASGVPENQASMNLRALQARGLLVARRSGVHIRYFPEPDPLVKDAAVVLKAVRRELKNGNGRETEGLRETLRAFTHSRRLTLLKCLTSQKEMLCETLVSKTRISRPAVCRHLETLRNAGLVRANEVGGWQLTPRSRLSALAKTLLEVIEKG